VETDRPGPLPVLDVLGMCLGKHTTAPAAPESSALLPQNGRRKPTTLGCCQN
jgi:hypothetical protein